MYRGRRPARRGAPREATYELLDGEPLDIFHDDERVHLEPATPETRAMDGADGGPGADAAAGPRAGAAASALAAEVEVDRADRRLVGQLGQQLVDDRVDLALVVAEVVAERPAARACDDLQLRAA